MDGLARQLQIVASNVETLVFNASTSHGTGNEISSSQLVNPLFEEHTMIQTSAVCLDFSKFHGHDPMGWVYCATQFFASHQTNPHLRVLFASFHMEGKALIWFQDLEASDSITSWEGFIQALQTQFGPIAYEDPMEALTRLHHTTTVEHYKSHFELLSNKLRGLTEPYKLSCFSSGLHEDIRFMVRMLNPPILHVAFGLAKMQKENVGALKRAAQLGLGSSGPTEQPLAPSPLDNHVVITIQKLTLAQIREWRECGLCYNCDDKWALGRRCKSTQLFLIDPSKSIDLVAPPVAAQILESKADSSLPIQFDHNMDPGISLHALVGSLHRSTMRVLGHINGKQAFILLDSRSSHNFLDSSLIPKCNLFIDSHTSLTVTIVDGQQLKSAGLCLNVIFHIQGTSFTFDFLILTLGGSEIVLGI